MTEQIHLQSDKIVFEPISCGQCPEFRVFVNEKAVCTMFEDTGSGLWSLRSEVHVGDYLWEKNLQDSMFDLFWEFVEVYNESLI